MAVKTHIVLRGSKRAKDPDARRVGEIDPKQRISVTIGLSGPKLPDSSDYIDQTLTPAELAEKFGARKQDAEKVATSLRKYGLAVDSVSLATRSMTVSGTAAAMEAAFKPGLAIMRSPDQGEYRGRQGTLQIPAELKGIVTGIFGLDQRQMARRKSPAAAAIPDATLLPLKPTDIERRYNFPPGDGAGQSIAIAEFGGGYFADDLIAYCGKFKRPVANVQTVPVDAPAYTLQQILALPPKKRKEQLDTSIEVMMDVEIIAGLCPKANISVYFSTFDQGGWVDLLNAVITANPAVLSISWGLAEDDSGWSANAINAIADRLNAARLLGITVCVSSGDDGSGDQIDDGNAHVDFPACSPFVLGVGGTMLKAAGADVKEVTWWETPGRRTNSGGGATGGGVSTLFPRPAWQDVHVVSLNHGSIDGRVVPDVSALAGEPFYDLIFLGKPQPSGGTSASAPLWAALIARIYTQLPQSKRHRFLTPMLYKNGETGKPIGKISSRDVASGNNTSNPQPGKGYKAGPGFDAVTGWGVPDGVSLLNSLQAI
ncbi:S53 family peptidase [Mesorhizobium sp. AR02]|uniref:S53 family peptidase n=1 Tax=Mesorhizobium sp. AR02 TaxID=2865837 RepID=UPI00215EF9F6|nr:S53 family peptidase [Mesorhizobium sp. AR02]UVK52860.1 S53 family peptidase [Mesorhizobium sp. AR02]